MTRVLRLGLFVATALFLTAIAPEAMAIDNCLRCTAIGDDGFIWVECARPPVGSLGFRYCFLEGDQDAYYCFETGDMCCVTGPAY